MLSGFLETIISIKPLNPKSTYRNIVRKYGQETGVNVDVNGFCVHSLRATAAASAFPHEADIAKVQEWLGLKYLHDPSL